MEAINYARDMKMDVVLVDTAGRMQVQSCEFSWIGFCTDKVKNLHRARKEIVYRIV